MVSLLIAGCATPMSLIEEANEGGRHDRREALAKIGELASREEGFPADPELRAALNRTLLERSAVEPNPSLRAQMLKIAVDANLPAASELLLRAYEDSHLAVRLEAMHSLTALPADMRRKQLNHQLDSGDDALLQIAAAFEYRKVGNVEWVPDLVEVIIDPRIDINVRFQAYLSALALTGEELMFLSAEWERWSDRAEQPQEKRAP